MEWGVRYTHESRLTVVCMQASAGCISEENKKSFPDRTNGKSPNQPGRTVVGGWGCGPLTLARRIVRFQYRVARVDSAKVVEIESSCSDVHGERVSASWILQRWTASCAIMHTGKATAKAKPIPCGFYHATLPVTKCDRLFFAQRNTPYAFGASSRSSFKPFTTK
jgi:hypothetical protein